ncbi:MAG: amidohydrolase family protein [Candidatus Heimdallarchaeota archaeon]|nr:MAG: amidohydrolase family protein [Candidatus Heimdallarchaeota archaeon]
MRKYLVYRIAILSLLLIIGSQYYSNTLRTADSLKRMAPNNNEFILTGKFLTINNPDQNIEAIYIKDEKIQDIGTKEEIFSLYKYKAPITVKSMGSNTILPGIIDGHTHVIGNTWEDGYDIAEAQYLALSNGFTTISEKFAHQDLIDALREAEAKGELKLRVNIFPSYNDAILDEERKNIILETWFPENQPILNNSKLVRIPGIKIFVDGAFIPERGMWAVSNPYSEEMKAYISEFYPEELINDYGDLYWEQDTLNQVVKLAQDRGFRVAFHAMGDRAIETTLNAIEYALEGNSNAEYRHQIEHNSYVRPDMVPRYQELDVLTSVRGYYPACAQSEYLEFFNDTADWNVRRYQLPNIVSYSYLETDYPYGPINPFTHLFGLVTRTGIHENGTLCEPMDWVKKYEITVEKALEIMTIGGAYAVSQEEYLGTIEKNKYADLIVVSESPTEISPENLKDITVLLTMVGGKIVYQNEDFTWEESQLTQSVSTPETSSTTEHSTTTDKSSTTTESSTITPSWTFPGLLVVLIALRKVKRLIKRPKGKL